MVAIATARSSVHAQHSNDIEGDSDKANIVGWAAALEASYCHLHWWPFPEVIGGRTGYLLSDVAPLVSCLRVLILDSKRRQAMVTASLKHFSATAWSQKSKPFTESRPLAKIACHRPGKAIRIR